MPNDSGKDYFIQQKNSLECLDLKIKYNSFYEKSFRGKRADLRNFGASSSIRTQGLENKVGVQ